MVKKRRLSSKAVAVLSRHGVKKGGGITEKENRFSTAAVAVQKEPEPPKSIVSEVVAEQLKKVTRFHKGYHLTDEQDHAVDLAETGDDLKIEAYAGAGKTSTLSAVSEAISEKDGMYIAFNKAIATEAAQSFPSNVLCKTAHSLAYKAVGYKYKSRLLSGDNNV